MYLILNEGVKEGLYSATDTWYILYIHVYPSTCIYYTMWFGRVEKNAGLGLRK